MISLQHRRSGALLYDDVHACVLAAPEAPPIMGGRSSSSWQSLWIASGLFTGTGAQTTGRRAGCENRRRYARACASPTLMPTARNATITVRGRTQALHAVDVRAEVEGVVQAIHFDKGDNGQAGDSPVRDQAQRPRRQGCDQAKALVAQTCKELRSRAGAVQADGFRSKTQLAQSRLRTAEAQAGLATMQIQLANTRIKAPFDGFVDDRYVECRATTCAPGDKCELVIAPEPFLAVGTVSEQEVGKISRRRPGERRRSSPARR